MRRTRRSLRAVALALALVGLVGAPRAEAHNSWNRMTQWAYVWKQPPTGWQTNYCTLANNGQNHGQHYMETIVRGLHGQSCNGNGYVKINHIVHKMEYYKTRVWGQPGQYCGTQGWYYNGIDDDHLVENRTWDIWSFCNYGVGIHVYLSVDTFQYTNGHFEPVPGQYWYGRDFRPATVHCHCP